MPLVQLVEAKGRPYDLALRGDRRTYADLAAHGDLEGEARLFLEAGVDGYFTDHPAEGVAARVRFVSGRTAPRRP